MAQRSGDVRLPPDVREIHTFEESSSFGTGPLGDVPPPVAGSAVPRPRSTTTRGRHERRSSAAAPLPWRDGRPSASEEDCRMVDGVRRALRFLFEAEQYQLEQALRDGYLTHCFSSLWEDSDEASSAATSLDIPDLADVEHRTGRARRQSRSSHSATSRGGNADNDPGRASADVPASSSSGPAPPAASLGPMPRAQRGPRLRVWASRAVAR